MIELLERVYGRNERSELLAIALVTQTASGLAAALCTRSLKPLLIAVVADVLLLCANRALNEERVREYLRLVVRRIIRNGGEKSFQDGPESVCQDASRTGSRNVSKPVSESAAQDPSPVGPCDRASMLPPVVTSDTTVDDAVTEKINAQIRHCEFPVMIRRPEVAVYDDGMDTRLQTPNGVGDPYSGGFRLWR